LERLKLVLDYLPAGQGYVEFNNTGIVFQHKTTESLRRELMRNGQLRQICGFDITLGVKG
jgi:hypothetical protein